MPETCTFAVGAGSVQVKLTVTLVLFQPFALAAGVRLPLMVGLVVSRLTGTVPVPVLPRASVAVADLVTTPSVVTLSVAGVGPLVTPDPASVAFQVIVTAPLFHPPAFGAGERVPVTVGPVLSSVY